MKFLLRCALLSLLWATSFADVIFKTCSRSTQEHGTVTLDDLGAFHIVLNLGKETFVSSTCAPRIPGPQIGISAIECSGDWKEGKGSVILDSMDGVLNVLMYKGPKPLPAQYYDDRTLFCGTPSRQSTAAEAK